MKGRPPGVASRSITITIPLKAAEWIHDMSAFAVATHNVNATEAGPIRIVVREIRHQAKEHLCKCGERFAKRNGMCDRCGMTARREAAKSLTRKVVGM